MIRDGVLAVVVGLLLPGKTRSSARLTSTKAIRLALATARTLRLLLDDAVVAYNTTKRCATKPVGL
jgi:hypothetical protein